MTVLRTFTGDDDDESADISILNENSDFDSMMDNGWQTLDDFQQADVLPGGYEVYSLTGETANHVVGRPSAFGNFVSLLNVLLYGKGRLGDRTSRRGSQRNKSATPATCTADQPSIPTVSCCKWWVEGRFCSRRIGTR